VAALEGLVANSCKTRAVNLLQESDDKHFYTPFTIVRIPKSGWGCRFWLGVTAMDLTTPNLKSVKMPLFFSYFLHPLFSASETGH
jgi:hypothetical protein